MAEYDEHVIRKRIRVYGDVQGVGFRYRAEHAAGLAGATGWVQNEPDGSVLMEIQGTEKQIDEVFVMINRGTYITITGMDTKCIPVEESEYGFRRR